ncbi:glycosyl hydrolase [Trichodelitschia bisporula]|uniref:Glycosyl hydrolase n=1 Tax=Trichodelitschia bisporula TaxID=703511 RepID=A0A6G1HQ13_9PEZI|nr:glycosyl hydrolase [Trichodelitschia bisporula]
MKPFLAALLGLLPLVTADLRSAKAHHARRFASCTTPLLVDDFASQSRLTFLFYNALLKPTSDDSTMRTITVSSNTATLTPNSADSYFYTQLGCLATVGVYDGISLRITAPPNTPLVIELSSSASCSDAGQVSVRKTAAELGWRFTGAPQLFRIPFAAFPGLDTAHLTTMLLTGAAQQYTLGPVALYCAGASASASEYISAPRAEPVEPRTPDPGPASSASAPPLLIDDFKARASNALGFWHGGDEALLETWGPGGVTLLSSDPDYSFYTQVTGVGCGDLSAYEGGYLRVEFSGSTAFSIALQEHNAACDEKRAPYPATWDSVEAERYVVRPGEIFVPLRHFKVEKRRALGVAFKGFYTRATTTLRRVEIVPALPDGVSVPGKLPTSRLVFGCTRPNSFAFAIDDGDPALAPEVMKIIAEEGIKVTFFTVGAPLLDPSTNLTSIYRDMRAQGHQIALHSYTHPKLEGLGSLGDIDWELENNLAAAHLAFPSFGSRYFRAPFGTEGARMRQRIQERVGGAAGGKEAVVVGWSVDVEDWLWATGPTPEKQLEAFKRDLARGGDLVVMHYLYPSTVGYLREFIRLAKGTGKRLMRVDQCLEDPEAPPLD